MLCKSVIERQFKKTINGYWQEVYIHSMLFMEGSDIIERKVERVEKGGLYREAANSEHSFHGEVVWIGPDKIQRRLIGVATDRSYPMYG